jgi:hypothetical protein
MLAFSRAVYNTNWSLPKMEDCPTMSLETLENCLKSGSFEFSGFLLMLLCLFKHPTCQTRLSGKWGSRETSLSTRLLLRVRMHSSGYESAKTDTSFAVMPRGTKVISAESWGISAWTKTAKVSVILPDGSPKRYFLKVNLSSSC